MIAQFCFLATKIPLLLKAVRSSYIRLFHVRSYYMKGVVLKY